MDAIVCPITQMRLHTAVGYTKSRVVSGSSLKWRHHKCGSGQQGLEKEADFWGLCLNPSPAPITYLANWTLDDKGTRKNEMWRWGHHEIEWLSAGLGSLLQCRFTWWLLSTSPFSWKKTHELQGRYSPCTGLGLAPSCPMGSQEGEFPISPWVFPWLIISQRQELCTFPVIIKSHIVSLAPITEQKYQPQALQEWGSFIHQF